ncbi:hypothetical protein FEM48_Zijuj05G0072600 [Ziziphus jujuba var. spinosa]|uniref:Rhodanese domain-containing protein n=1 Tax=Ziziphus jujuba var. spinosa TaxID=714518 RepID=A0A978U840_ZIZJJ|nr:hypothetical protein FEM48_ZijujUnG0107500 [Ziziphus jujuba var. spinosa]KAH7528442.1 hypothetical protein FEM48_Zijuj05G0072600 [Ziziphus jujuba var. spinosa]
MGSFLSSSKKSQEELEMALDKAKQIVNSNPVVVFSKTYCGYCKRVKQLLTQLGASYKVIELDEESKTHNVLGLLAFLSLILPDDKIVYISIVLDTKFAFDFLNIIYNSVETFILWASKFTKEVKLGCLIKFKALSQLYSLPVTELKKKIVFLLKGDGSEIQSELAKWTGQRTVPNVFIGGKHIGGCDSVLEKHQAGLLVPLLTDAGAITNNSAQL